MNINVEDISPCRKRLRIEVPANRVSEEFEKVTSEFTKFVRIPGFRPGKAPRSVVVKRYQKEIENELQRKLVPEAYREACDKRKLRVVSAPNMEDVRYEHGLSLSFSTVVECAPDFSLPEYKSISVKETDTTVSDVEIEKTMEAALAQQGKFIDVTGRALAENDFAVIKYHGTVDGKPILEIAPDARQLAGAESQWLWIKPESFVPGFTEKLIGMNAGESRTVTVSFPEDVAFETLRGKSATYDVELKGIKLRELPELTDELAQQIAQVPASEFRQKIRDTLQQQKERDDRSEKKRQIANHLAAVVDFDLPESLVQSETQDVVRDIVAENQERGVSTHVLEEKKREIFDNASRSAKEIVKLNFILRRIAEAEGLKVENDQLGNYVALLSSQYEMPIEKLVKQLRDTGGLRQIEQRLLTQNVMDFLLAAAKVEKS